MNIVKKFQKRKEDFICENCGQKNKGDGYSNHCAFCLWSKHVDIFPGDRLEDCAGLMEPVEIIYKPNKMQIRHKCVKCGTESIAPIKDSDNKDELFKIAEKIANKKAKELDL